MMGTPGGPSANQVNINQLKKRLQFTERNLKKLNFLARE